MKLAIESPNYLLKDIQPLVDFDFILAHLVLRDKVYTEHYRGSQNFKILDNSVNELLEPCSIEEMEKALSLLGGVDLIVPPDHLGDLVATRDSLEQALSTWPKEKLLPVVQGETVDEVVDCASDYLEMGFNRLAVPYDITTSRTDSREFMAERRLQIVNRITTLVPIGFWIHLLGMTTLEELEAQNRGWVRSIDTGVPIVYGMNLEHLDGPWDFKKDRPTMSQMDPYLEDFIDTSTRHNSSPSDKLSAIFWNIAYLRKILGS